MGKSNNLNQALRTKLVELADLVTQLQADNPLAKSWEFKEQDLNFEIRRHHYPNHVQFTIEIDVPVEDVEVKND